MEGGTYRLDFDGNQRKFSGREAMSKSPSLRWGKGRTTEKKKGQRRNQKN
jgi:hypothetical protein